MTTISKLAENPIFNTPISLLKKLWSPPFELYKAPCLRTNAKTPEKFLHIKTIASDVMPKIAAHLASQDKTPAETNVLIWGYGTILILPYIFTQMGFPVSGVEYGGKSSTDIKGNMFAKLEYLFLKNQKLKGFGNLNCFTRFSHLMPDNPVYDLAFIVNPHPGLWVSDSGLEQQIIEWTRWLKPGALSFLQIDGDINDPEAIANKIFLRILQGREFKTINIKFYSDTDAPFPSFYKDYTKNGNAVLTLEKI
ncbi:hypothetical protein A2526_00180 [candidate division WOR-1 bacterium RIFOXYD2_FULL_36_8]|uniref:Uncharacterized protein n=1 Tax=candidate division WOR-1 bacterium RIFOXYB2_FULL_36_35 TaxID=1802578 RepID=A0A1F4RXT1_UNCSA|nr:MAG: hypothetical protein A2230_03350 [candidate division WOR-1 bacterium RIFOXYA2_FULL_36_21]OGC12982.1 MAG: hypothetical protein A2290_04950 [candidate division WOR-1 bacterium RIFOXYB2_FULL_36_35]OGC15196.1 MAG: hypothetical protein A2282_07550 [candidate division WOR-1 bacterium RIFOXYA12_FULL_36_13]OGC40058.1 MAG: hypothetical protein A2526_00180 [candidate division WOR-1 bacterium RIFOXYD2_FULL_36_8]